MADHKLSYLSNSKAFLIKSYTATQLLSNAHVYFGKGVSHTTDSSVSGLKVSDHTTKILVIKNNHNVPVELNILRAMEKVNSYLTSEEILRINDNPITIDAGKTVFVDSSVFSKLAIPVEFIQFRISRLSTPNTGNLTVYVFGSEEQILAFPDVQKVEMINAEDLQVQVQLEQPETLETALIKIKGANTDWWINEKSMVGMDGLTYVAYYTNKGEVRVKSIDTKNKNAVNKDVIVARLNSDYADEHNAPSLAITQSGRIVIGYTGHDFNTKVFYRVTANPYDLNSFGEEKSIEFGLMATYSQMLVVGAQLWLFTRVNRTDWAFTFSSDDGETWSTPKTILSTESGQRYYMNARAYNFKNGETNPLKKVIFATAGHPIQNTDNSIRVGMFDTAGDVYVLNGTAGTKVSGVNIKDSANLTTIDINSLETIYTPPEGYTCRLLGISVTEPLRIAFAKFNPDAIATEPATYGIATYDFSAKTWKVNDNILSAGSFLSTSDMADGSQTYVPGIDFYYGMGSASLTFQGGTSFTEKFYAARLDVNSNTWKLESYVTHDGGTTYSLDEVIREIPNDGKKIWRPIVPVFADDNMPVYWHEGYYTAHTGGWTSDVRSRIEYDN